MSFLLDLIHEQKLLDKEVAVNEFIEEHGIGPDSVIHTLIFDKEIYKTEQEVREYIKDKFIYPEGNIEDAPDAYAIRLVSSYQVDMQSEITVEIRRGVKALAADLVVTAQMSEINFNDKGETIYGSVDLGAKDIHLNEGLPYIIEVARVAEGDHPMYGKLKITQEHLESMENNFKSKVSGVDLAINEDHKKNGAFGWFKDVFLSHDKQTLFAQVVWNAKGTTALSEKEYRYFSPEFRFNYTHPHTGQEHGPTLLGGALTNYPFLKMDAITELSIKNHSQGETVSTENKTISLSDHDRTVVELNGKITDIQGKLDAANQKNIELSNKVNELTETAEKAEKEKVHEKLFSEGKISKAQLVALNEGKGMLEVLSLSEKMNTEAKGSGEAPEVIELSDKDRAVARSLNLTDEEYAKYNK